MPFLRRASAIGWFNVVDKSKVFEYGDYRTLHFLLYSRQNRITDALFFVAPTSSSPFLFMVFGRMYKKFQQSSEVSVRVKTRLLGTFYFYLYYYFQYFGHFWTFLPFIFNFLLFNGFVPIKFFRIGSSFFTKSAPFYFINMRLLTNFSVVRTSLGYNNKLFSDIITKIFNAPGLALVFRCVKNNFYLTLVSPRSGDVFWKYSGGAGGFKGKQKKTVDVLRKAVLAFVLFLRGRGYSAAAIFIKILRLYGLEHRFHKNLCSILLRNNIYCNYMSSEPLISHGYMRLRKKRRL